MPAKEINLQGVYGAGPDGAFGGGMRWLAEEVKKELGAKVVVHNFLDFDAGQPDYQELLRRLRRWRDPTVLYAHSCGCNFITHGSVEVSQKQIAYLLAIAPSIYCKCAPLKSNVLRASQGTSNWLDFFNPGARMLVSTAPGNQVTKLDNIKTGMGAKRPVNHADVKRKHVRASYSPLLRDRLIAECKLALTT